MLGFLKKKKGRKGDGFSPFKAGVIFLVLLVPALFFGFTKTNPFANPYTVTAFVESANNLKVGTSFVRVAGVNVGLISDVQAMPDGTAKIEMDIQNIGWPVHEDAELKIRPRIFLEGNFFVDLHPGSPSSPVLPEDGGVIPINQTAYPVQFAQLLSALQSDTRKDLRTFLAEFSLYGLKGGGAASFNRSIPYWEPAYKYSSLANVASLGTEPHDLSNLLRGQQRTFEALSRDENALKGLITNFNITANALARENEALEFDVVALRDLLRSGPPALRSLNAALPSLRAFARDALPGTRSTPAAIDAQIPFVRQARGLVSGPELKGLVADLRPTIPALARLNRSQIPLLEQSALFSSCQNEVFIPFLETPIPDPDFPEIDGELVREAVVRVLPALSGESRVGDANSQMFRVLATTGGSTVVERGEQSDENRILQLPEGANRVRPARPDERPQFRPAIACESQEPPNMNAPGTTAGEEIDIPTPKLEKLSSGAQKRAEERLRGAVEEFSGFPTLNNRVGGAGR